MKGSHPPIPLPQLQTSKDAARLYFWDVCGGLNAGMLPVAVQIAPGHMPSAATPPLVTYEQNIWCGLIWHSPNSRARPTRQTGSKALPCAF